MLDADVGVDLCQHAVELIDVGRWTVRSDHAQDRMTRAADNEHQLPEAFVRNPLFRPIRVVFVGVAAVDVIATGMVGIEPTGIAGTVGHVASVFEHAMNGIGQELAHLGQCEQSMTRFLVRPSPAAHGDGGQRFPLDFHNLLTPPNRQIGHGGHLRSIETFAILG